MSINISIDISRIELDGVRSIYRALQSAIINIDCSISIGISIRISIIIIISISKGGVQKIKKEIEDGI